MSDELRANYDHMTAAEFHRFIMGKQFEEFEKASMAHEALLGIAAILHGDQHYNLPDKQVDEALLVLQLVLHRLMDRKLGELLRFSVPALADKSIRERLAKVVGERYYGSRYEVMSLIGQENEWHTADEVRFREALRELFGHGRSEDEQV